jgi:uncharacterized protein YkwD
MPKKTLNIFIFFLIFLNIQTAEAAIFSDMAETNQNYEAINWLKTNNIIEGYEDGTFKPESQINRAELLKIIIEGFEYPDDVNTATGFPDVDESAWYGKYVRKGKSMGWIEGYPDGTFKPEQAINKAETLKILGKVKNWELTNPSEQTFSDTPTQDWYSSYVSYAKNKNFLEETGEYFSPAAFTTRAKFSEMVYRIIAVEKSGAENYYKGLTPETTIGSEQTLPSQIYNSTFFSGVRLNETFPNIFYINELYTFEGILDQGKTDCFAYISLNNFETYKTFLGEVNGNTCKIQVIFEDPGIQYLGIIPALEGYNPPAEIEVLNSLPINKNTETSDTPVNLSPSYTDGKTNFKFDNGSNTIAKIIFTQEGKSKTFFSRQNPSNINIPFTSFADFKEGQMKWHVEGAKSKMEIIGSDPFDTFSFHILSPFKSGEIKTFTAVVHSTSILDKELIVLNNFQDTSIPNKELNLSGKTKSYIETEAYITTPEGFVETVNIDSSSQITNYYGSELYAPERDFNLRYTPKETGVYIFEINDKEGVAVLNSPVYIGNIIPLIPDFFDLNSFELNPESEINLDDARKELLKLINEDREKLGISQIAYTSDLNTLAQNHSDDMMNNNYFSHISLDGKSPEDRRLESGIKMPVGENIVKSVSIAFAHESLMRSPAHRMQIIDENWTEVGLGIAKDTEGYLIITEEFSREPISEADLTNIENKLFEDINDFRIEKEKIELTSADYLALSASSWSKKMTDEDFFSFQSPNGDKLIDSLTEESGEFSFLIIEGNFTSDFFSYIKEKENTLISTLWSKIGIGAASDLNTGNIKITIIFST